jgi:hypothetical protein
MEDSLEAGMVTFSKLGYRVVVRNRRDRKKSVEKGLKRGTLAVVRWREGSIRAPSENYTQN